MVKMATNILKAIINIKNYGNNSLEDMYTSKIRINNWGVALEFFVKDAFSNSFDQSTRDKKEELHRKNFSYLGNQNNPPDVIIKNSDAIEVKKINALRFNDLALNSSYPKSKLLSDSPMITSACRECESNWKQKDMIYAIGFIENNQLKLLNLVYGDCYAASPEIYERVKNAITGGLQRTDLEFSETRELGRINRVDPLGITNLRIRGMWTIQNPMKVFSDFFSYEPNINKFDLFAIMRESKYNTFEEADKSLIENDKEITVENIDIKNPDNPAKLLKAKLIKYSNIN